MIGSKKSWDNIDILLNAGLMGKTAIPRIDLLNLSDSELYFYAFQMCPLLYLLYDSENSFITDLIHDMNR